jgi:hypothetical protein
MKTDFKNERKTEWRSMKSLDLGKMVELDKTSKDNNSYLSNSFRVLKKSIGNGEIDAYNADHLKKFEQMGHLERALDGETVEFNDEQQKYFLNNFSDVAFLTDLKNQEYLYGNALRAVTTQIPGVGALDALSGYAFSSEKYVSLGDVLKGFDTKNFDYKTVDKLFKLEPLDDVKMVLYEKHLIFLGQETNKNNNEINKINSDYQSLKEELTKKISCISTEKEYIDRFIKVKIIDEFAKILKTQEEQKKCSQKRQKEKKYKDAEEMIRTLSGGARGAIKVASFFRLLKDKDAVILNNAVHAVTTIAHNANILIKQGSDFLKLGSVDPVLAIAGAIASVAQMLLKKKKSKDPGQNGFSQLAEYIKQCTQFLAEKIDQVRDEVLKLKEDVKDLRYEVFLYHLDTKLQLNNIEYLMDKLGNQIYSLSNGLYSRLDYMEENSSRRHQNQMGVVPLERRFMNIENLLQVNDRTIFF